jgi:fibronectin type 3 domain-containing protein
VRTRPWKFIAVGDTRGDGVPINTTILPEIANEIVRQRATFVIVPGDLVNSGSSENFQSWKDLMGPVYSAGIKVYPVLGNHDDNDVLGFISAFGADIPNNGPTGEIDRTYAIEYDNVLVLALDTYVNSGRVNQTWVNEKLIANTRPHVFAFGHMPAFKANHTDCLDDYPTQRNTFWNSLKNAGSTVYFCGHDHFYDHMRVDDGDDNPYNDVHQMIVGGGGAPLYTSYAYDGVNAPWTPKNVYHENQFGYTLVEVDGNTITMTYYHRSASNTYLPTSDVWTYTVGTPPAPPTGLTSTPGNSQVALSWIASSNATSYNASGVTGTSYTDSTVTNGTTYYYVVTAVNAAGESGHSDTVSATPQLSPPNPPGGLMAIEGIGMVTLQWTASTGASAYNVKRSIARRGAYNIIAAGVTETTYTDTNVAGGTTYYYVVSAVASPPGVFTLTARTGSKAGQIKLTWTKSSGATSYDVTRATTAGGPYTTVRTGMTALSYTDFGLIRGQIYYYVITARNTGDQRDSNEASAKAK